jgi:hypothetical protein
MDLVGGWNCPAFLPEKALDQHPVKHRLGFLLTCPAGDMPEASIRFLTVARSKEKASDIFEILHLKASLKSPTLDITTSYHHLF